MKSRQNHNEFHPFRKRKCSKAQWTGAHWEQREQKEERGLLSHSASPSLERAGRSWRWVRSSNLLPCPGPRVPFPRPPMVPYSSHPVRGALCSMKIYKSQKRLWVGDPAGLVQSVGIDDISLFEDAGGTLREWRCKGRGREMKQFLSQPRRRIAEMKEIGEEIYIRG